MLAPAAPESRLLYNYPSVPAYGAHLPGIHAAHDGVREIAITQEMRYRKRNFTIHILRECRALERVRSKTLSKDRIEPDQIK